MKTASLTASAGAADDPYDEPSSGEKAPRPRGGRRPHHSLRLAAATVTSPPRLSRRRLLRHCSLSLLMHSFGHVKETRAGALRGELYDRGDSRVFISHVTLA